MKYDQNVGISYNFYYVLKEYFSKLNDTKYK